MRKGVKEDKENAKKVYTLEDLKWDKTPIKK